jgi:lipopolysaccharide biosynthesis glycosyltransferase
LANKYPNELLSHDQTLLNAVCEGNFVRLTNRFNNAWFAGSKEPQSIEDTIIHFVGSPKPWDLLARLCMEDTKFGSSFTTKSWKRQYGKITFDKIRRTYKIRKSILNHLKKRLLKYGVIS